MKRELMGIKLVALVDECKKGLFDKVMFDEGVLKITNIDGCEIEVEIMEYDISNEEENEKGHDEFTVLPRII